MKKLLSLLLLVAMVFSFAGCATEDAETKPEGEDTIVENDDEVKGLSGTVSISGSTSVEKIGKATAEEFMALNPDVQVTYEGIGSSSGVKNAKDGVTKLGTASRNLKEEEKTWGLTEVTIAYDGVAVITHPSNNMEGLTVNQVQAIYKGEITNWSEVGGEDKEIVVVSREDGSGTRGAFEEIVGFEGELTKNALIAEGNGNVQTTVAGNPQAIGYVSFTYINETVKPMLIEGVEPTADNVLAEAYPISRPFLMLYKEENIDEATQAFVDFVLSAEGQMIVEEEGGISVK